MQVHKLGIYDLLVILGLFVGITLVLGIPFIHWGFLHDDFGVIWHVRLDSWDAVLKLFTEPGANVFLQPSNYQMPEQSFFAVLYRPLSHIFYALQYLVFGFSAYGYFLVMIVLHAINTALFFFLLRTFFPLLVATLAALFFGFHISYWDWMGWISGQMHVLNYTLFLSIVCLIKAYVDTGRVVAYLLALLLFLVSLFTRETGLVMPFWIAWALYEYQQYASPRLGSRSLINKIALHLFLIDVFYLGIRSLIFPFKLAGEGLKVIVNPFDFIVSLQGRFFDAVTFAADVANLSWLAGGHRLLKGSLIACVFLILAMLFVFNRHKRIIVLLLLSGFLFMWPALLRYYSSRYLYKALPFFIAAGALLITRFGVRRVGVALVSAIIIVNATLLAFHMKNRESVLHATARAFALLADDLQGRKEVPCFVALPYDIFPTGVAQALWMYGYDANRPVVYDNATFVWRARPEAKDCVRITSNKRALLFESLDPTFAWWNPFNHFTRMGTITIDEQNSNGNVVRMRYEFDSYWQKQHLLFVTWDYAQHRFTLLNKH